MLKKILNLGILVIWVCFANSITFSFYGDIQMNNTTKLYGFPPVIFPHWFHRIEFKCSVCHPNIFVMEAGAHRIMMERMYARGIFCATCHNGKVAWMPVNCARCHRVDEKVSGSADQNSEAMPQPGPPFARENSDPNLLLKNFPRDLEGNIDWIEAIKRGLISPRSSLKTKGPDAVSVPPDIVMPRTQMMPAVIFPHTSHALWLECENCHPDVFIAKSGANQISMDKIRVGQYCGKCHDKVAFPLSQCNRCHRQWKIVSLVDTHRLSPWVST